MTETFDYTQAFARNLGWVTEREQQILRGKRVAIAGLGGVGGFHLLTLARLGVGKYHIADPDRFELANFNRQVGALISTLDRPKAEVLTEMVRDINPEVELKVFPDGVTSDNIDKFLQGVNLYIDGLDFFAFEARERVFAQCYAKGIPAITAAPLGMGAAVLNFLPGGMSFEDYFQLKDRAPLDKALRFLVGLAPRALHRGYLVDGRWVDLAAGRGPSTVIACTLCAGVAAAEALKILLGRGGVRAAPHGYQFDAYHGRLVHTWRPGGNRHPLNRLALAVARHRFGKIASCHDIQDSEAP